MPAYTVRPAHGFHPWGSTSYGFYLTHGLNIWHLAGGPLYPWVQCEDGFHCVRPNIPGFHGITALIPINSINMYFTLERLVVFVKGVSLVFSGFLSFHTEIL